MTVLAVARADISLHSVFLNVTCDLYSYFSYILWLKKPLKVSLMVLFLRNHFAAAAASVYYRDDFANCKKHLNCDLYHKL